MRVLLMKTSSMGDLIHTLPALTDAGKAIPGIQFDWVVEDAFAEIPSWHPLVDKVIPVSLRRWRKGIFSGETRAGWQRLREQLRERQYDLILDAQGLVKSAFLTYFANGMRAGLDFRSAREGLASFAYQQKHTVNFYQHAIIRMRSLFSKALHYELPETLPDFGLDRHSLQDTKEPANENYLVFLHGTTWVTKQWPEEYWLQLSRLASQAGFRIKIGGGNPDEVERAKRIAAQNPAIDLVPYLSISAMAKLLAGAKGAVAVDTGFGHLAAALNLPTVSIYGPTNPEYTGALGDSSIHLSTTFPCTPCLSRQCTFKETKEVAPACYTTLPPSLVWQTVKGLIEK